MISKTLIFSRVLQTMCVCWIWTGSSSLSDCATLPSLMKRARRYIVRVHVHKHMLNFYMHLYTVCIHFTCVHSYMYMYDNFIPRSAFTLLSSLCLQLFSHLPDISLECSSNVLQIHTCVDSCIALRDLLVYLASDGDLRPQLKAARETNSSQATNDSSHASLVRLRDREDIELKLVLPFFCLCTLFYTGCFFYSGSS